MRAARPDSGLSMRVVRDIGCMIGDVMAGCMIGIGDVDCGGLGQPPFGVSSSAAGFSHLFQSATKNRRNYHAVRASRLRQQHIITAFKATQHLSKSHAHAHTPLLLLCASILLALTSRYFARSSVEKLPIPCRLFVHANLRVAQGSNAEGALLRYDSAAQIHTERRHAAG